MPQFGSHLSGPIRHTTRLGRQGDRAWFRDLPVGMNDPDFVHQIVDFIQVDDYNTTNYTLSSSGTGTSAAVNTSSSAKNGILLLSTGSTAGNYANVQSKDLAWLLDRTLVPNTHPLQSSKRLWFEAGFTADVASTDVNLFVGLSETQTNVFGLSQNYVGFTVSNGGATITYASSTAGAVTSGTKNVTGSNNSVTLVQGTQISVGFQFESANHVNFYINRNYMNTFVAGSLPSSPLALAYQIQTNAASNRTLSLDYVYVCKTR